MADQHMAQETALPSVAHQQTAASMQIPGPIVESGPSAEKAKKAYKPEPLNLDAARSISPEKTRKNSDLPAMPVTPESAEPERFAKNISPARTKYRVAPEIETGDEELLIAASMEDPFAPNFGAVLKTMEEEEAEVKGATSGIVSVEKKEIEKVIDCEEAREEDPFV